MTDILKKIYYSKLFILIALAGVFVVASVPAFRNAVYDGHDLKFHFGRIQAIAEALQAGQFPVRYEQNAWFGHGYVSLLFYGNIFLYIPALLYMTGMPVFRAYNIYVLLVNLATVLVGYYSFKKLFNDNILGLIATVIYSLAGYRLTNLYVRTSLGEYTAMIFIPLCVWGIYRIYEDKESNTLKKIMPIVIGMTGLIESHILMTEMVVILAVAFALINFNRTKLVLKEIGLAILLTFLLNSFFIIPFLHSYISMTLNINAPKNVDDIQGNGLYLSQVFGIITEGKGYNSIWSTEHEECYRPGLLVILSEILIVAGIIKAAILKNKTSKNNDIRYPIQMMIFGAVATWMATVYFPWNIVAKLGVIGKILAAVQYPSRFLGIQLICFVIAGVYSIRFCIKMEVPRIVVLVIISVLALGMTGIFDYTLSFGTNMTNDNAIDEWADKFYLPEGTNVDALYDTEIIYKDNEIVLPVLAYDNVRVYDNNGKEIATHVSDNNCIAVDSSVNVDIISVEYKEPVLWRLSEVITLLTLAGVIALNFKKRKM